MDNHFQGYLQALELFLARHDKKISSALLFSFAFFLSLALIKLLLMLAWPPINFFFDHHIGKIQFWLQYGPFGTAPNWYGGYDNFFSYPPLFLAMAYPLALAFGANTAYVFSVMLAIAGASFAALLISRKMGISKDRALLALAAVWGNMFSINQFLLIGRAGELMGTAVGIVLTFYMLYLLDRKISWRDTAVLGALFALLGYGYILLVPLYGTLVLGLFAAKPEARLKIGIASLMAMLAVLPWLAGFARVVSNAYPRVLESATADAAVGLFAYLPAAALVVAAGFSAFRKQKTFVAFWLLLAGIYILNLLSGMFLRILPFSYFHAGATHILIVFLAITGIILTSVRKEARRIHTALLIAMLVLSIALFVGREVKFSSFPGTYFFHTNLNNSQEIDSMLQKIDMGRGFIYLGNSRGMYSSIYGYAVSKYNLTTPLGTYNEVAPKSAINIANKITGAFPCGMEVVSSGLILTRERCPQEMDCKSLRDGLLELNVSWVLASRNIGAYLDGCGYEKAANGSYVVLYRIA